MGKGFKISPTPGAHKAPAPIRAPENKEMPPPENGIGSSEGAHRAQSPDGPRAGFEAMPSGRRQFKDEIPYPPAERPRLPMKVK